MKSLSSEQEIHGPGAVTPIKYAWSWVNTFGWYPVSMNNMIFLNVLRNKKSYIKISVSGFQRVRREWGRDREAITSSGLHFNSHLIHGKFPCLLKKKDKGWRNNKT